MCVPLRDQSGKVRYYLGAQLDITDLLFECTGLPTLRKLIRRQNEDRGLVDRSDIPSENLQEDTFEQLSQVFNPTELEQLLASRQRQQLESIEGVRDADMTDHHKGTSSLGTPPYKLDSTFQIDGGGSAPPLGYYKTVSFSLQTSLD